MNNEINDAVELKNEVVVLSDETLLIPVINSIPCNRKSISVTMGYPYSKTIVNHFVHNLFALEKNIDKDNKIYFWSLKRLLETEIFKIIFNDEEQKLLVKSTNDFLKESNYYITVNEIDKYFVQEKVNHFLKLMLRKWDSSIDCISRLKSILIYANECITSNDNNFIKNQISVAGRILNKIEKLINKYNVRISKLYELGYERNGCMYCAFGVHLENTPNRFQRLKTTHPTQYAYLIRNFAELLHSFDIDIE